MPVGEEVLLVEGALLMGEVLLMEEMLLIEEVLLTEVDAAGLGENARRTAESSWAFPMASVTLDLRKQFV